LYQYSFEIDTLGLMVDIDAVKRRFESLLPAVDERMRRLIAGAESLAMILQKNEINISTLREYFAINGRLGTGVS
jgi:hypothetical protein